MHNYVVWIKDIRVEKQADLFKKQLFDKSSSELNDIEQQKKEIQNKIKNAEDEKKESARIMQEAVEEFNRSSMISSFKRYLIDLIVLIEQYEKATDNIEQKKEFIDTAAKLNSYLKMNIIK